MNHDSIIQTEEKNPLDQSQIFNDILFSGVNVSHLAILVTPVCDLAQIKADHYTFCAILPFEEAFFTYIDKSCGIKKNDFYAGIIGKKKECIIKYLKAVFNNQFPRYHWIGKIPDTDGLWYIDYQLIQSLSVDLYPNIKEKRIAKLLSPLKESIFVRYSSYMGRVGLLGEEKDRDEYAKYVIDYFTKKNLKK